MAIHRAVSLRALLTSGVVAVLSVPIALSRADDAPPPAYVQTGKASGTAVSVGARSMAMVMSDWAVQFKRFHPDAKLMIQHAGSDEAPKALLDGSATFASMDRPMSENEQRAFADKFGYPPTSLRVAADALAVLVHKDNPIRGVTVPQLDAVFSGTRRCGYNYNFTSWDQLGLGTAWKNRPFRLSGRDSKSAAYAFFAERALCKGKFRDDIQAYDKPREIARFVAARPEAMAYSNLANMPDDVRVLPVAPEDGKPFVAPTPQNIGNASYPLSQFLYIYVNKAPGRASTPIEREFLRLVLSAKGQALASSNGFMPMTGRLAQEELAKLN